MQGGVDAEPDDADENQQSDGEQEVAQDSVDSASTATATVVGEPALAQLCCGSSHLAPVSDQCFVARRAHGRRDARGAWWYDGLADPAAGEAWLWLHERHGGTLAKTQIDCNYIVGTTEACRRIGETLQ